MKRHIYDLHARETIIKLGRETKVMGIVNCTPDSFSGDGKVDSALAHAHKLMREGADIIDIGGESTRPGASNVSLKEETRRVIPVIQTLARTTKIPISIDTSKLEVAKQALDEGAVIVNNVRSLKATTSFLKMVRDYKASIVIMHMRGTPVTMHRYAKYKNVISEVTQELKISIEKCLAIGIKKERIIVDPGIGFSKDARQNLTLINHLNHFKALDCPILLGASRKSFIGHVLKKEVGERLIGSISTVIAGVMNGAHIARVHDVKATKESLRMIDAILNAP